MSTNPTTRSLLQRPANLSSTNSTQRKNPVGGQRRSTANSKEIKRVVPQRSVSSPKSPKVGFSPKDTPQPAKAPPAPAKSPRIGEQILTGVGNTLKETALAPLKTIKYLAWDAPRKVGSVLGSFAVGSGATGANPFDKHDAQKNFVAQVTPKPGRLSDVVKNTVLGESGARALAEGRTAEAHASAATNLLMMGIPGSKGIPGRKLDTRSFRPPANPPKAPAPLMELVPATATSASIANPLRKGTSHLAQMQGGGDSTRVPQDVARSIKPDDVTTNPGKIGEKAREELRQVNEAAIELGRRSNELVERNEANKKLADQATDPNIKQELNNRLSKGYKKVQQDLLDSRLIRDKTNELHQRANNMDELYDMTKENWNDRY